MAIRPNGTHQTILIVDDNESFRSILTKVLKRLGFDVAEAASGEAALALLECAEQRVDLVLTDVMMPGMNGVVLAERLTSLRRGLVILFMSGYPFALLQRECSLSKENMPHFLQKPFDIETLTAKVNRVLGRQRSKSL